MQKFHNKACCCGNFPTKHSFVKIFHKGKNFVEICHKSIFWWKLTMKGTFCWNFQQGGSSFCGKFSTKQNIFFWNFSMKKRTTWKEFCDKTAWYLVQISAKSTKLTKFPRSNAVTMQGFWWLWGWPYHSFDCDLVTIRN